MSHLKSYVVPRSWTLKRKEQVFVARPKPGAHPAELSVPLIHALRVLGFAKTVREAKRIMQGKGVHVDGKPANDYKMPVGLMDVITIVPLKQSVRVLLDPKGKLVYESVAEAKRKVAKVRGKTVLAGGKIQLNLSDGRNMLTDKPCKVGDSVVFSIPDQKVEAILKLEKGATVYLIKGRHTGMIGTVDDVQNDRLWFKVGKEVFETPKEYALVVGDVVKK